MRAAIKEKWSVEEWVIRLAVALRVGHSYVLFTLLDEAQPEPHLVLGAARAFVREGVEVDWLWNLLFRTCAVAYLVEFARLEQQFEAGRCCGRRLLLFLYFLYLDGSCGLRGRYRIQLELELLLFRLLCLDLFFVVFIVRRQVVVLATELYVVRVVQYTVPMVQLRLKVGYLLNHCSNQFLAKSWRVLYSYFQFYFN